MPDARPDKPLHLRVRFARLEDLRFFYEKQIRVDRSLRVETKGALAVGQRVQVLLSLVGSVGTLPLAGHVTASAEVPGMQPAVTITLDEGEAAVASVASFMDYVESLYEATAAKSAERRLTTRLAVTAPVWLRFDADAAFANFYTKDVSRSGMFVFSNAQFTDGAPVEVLLATPGDERGFVIAGKIARHESTDLQRKGGLAIQFADDSPYARDQLSRYLQVLAAAGGTAPARLFAEPPKAVQPRPDVPPGVGTREPDPEEAIARLKLMETRTRVLLRPQSLDRLRDLFVNELRKGLLFVYAERPPEVGRAVDLTLLVPGSADPIPLEGKVERFEPDPQRAGGGRVAIRLLPLSATQDALLARLSAQAAARPAPAEPLGGARAPVAQEDTPSASASPGRPGPGSENIPR